MGYLPTYAGEGATVYTIEKGINKWLFSVCEQTNTFSQLDKNNNMLQNCTLAFYVSFREINYK